MKKEKKDNSVLFGIILIILGVYFFLERILPWLNIGFLWPAILISIGLFLVFKKN